eukprot:244832_1
MYNCAGKHGLRQFRTPSESEYGCNVCRNSYPEHTSMFGCRTCNYDVCVACATPQHAIKDQLDVSEYIPTCPVILFAQGNNGDPKQICTLHCQKLNVYVECFVSTAIISIEGEWINQTNDTSDCSFVLPTAGTVIDVTMNTIPQPEAGRATTQNETTTRDGHTPQTPKLVENPNEPYYADLFRFSCGDVDPGSTISVKCKYFETLNCNTKGYIVSLPLYFPLGTIRENANWDEIVAIECKINGVSSDTEIDCWTHRIKYTINEEAADDRSILVQCVNCKPLKEERKEDETTGHVVEKTGRDFELSYQVDTSTTQAHCIGRTDSNGSNSGCVCAFVTPSQRTIATYDRAYFFLLDKSASMMGEPYREATRALHRALDSLRPSDKFNVCVFDHEQTCYQRGLVFANKEMVSNCRSWIKQYEPQEITSLQPQLPHDLNEKLSNHAVFVMSFLNNDREEPEGNEERMQSQNEESAQRIRAMHPIRKQTSRNGTQLHKEDPFDGSQLHEPLKTALEQTEQSDLLPFIVIISDGDVRDKHLITEYIDSSTNMRTRIVTLGIGSYCHWYFLTLLAKLGGGFSDVVVFRERLYFKMDGLLRLANAAVLTDVEFGINSEEIELFPFPIPDLFVGAPLVITARYISNKCPSKVEIRGFDCHGTQEPITTRIETRDDLPIDKIFAKQQTDAMAVNAWMNKELPSTSTALVVFADEEEHLHDLPRSTCRRPRGIALCCGLIAVVIIIVLIFLWNSVADCDWCILSIFLVITFWFFGSLSWYCTHLKFSRRSAYWIQLIIFVMTCVMIPVVIIVTMRLNIMVSISVLACSAFCCWIIYFCYHFANHKQRLTEKIQQNAQWDYAGTRDKINSLYWIYNEKSRKLLGPFNKERICEMYISHEIHGKIRIQNVKSAGMDRDWFEVFLPPLYAQDLRKLATTPQEYTNKDEHDAKNIEIQSRFKKYFPNLYEALKAQKMCFNNELISVPGVPLEVCYGLGTHHKVLMVLAAILRGIILIVVHGAFCVWFLLSALWSVIHRKSFNRYRASWTQHFSALVIYNPPTSSDKAVMICGIISKFISALATGCLIVYIVYIYGGYSEIQSWMVGYVTWIFCSVFVSCLYQYARATSNVKLVQLISSISLFITGIEISEQVDDKMVNIFRPLMCLLPASICGFLANYMLEERFMLKCNESYTDSNVCFDDGVGCCQVINSHDLNNSYYFTGGLVSNILASFTVIRLSAWIMTFENHRFAALSSKKN